VADVVAALDCGSNSTRLLVANAQVRCVREMRITRLSEGVDATATLLETAMQRTFDVLGDYRRLMDETKSGERVTRGDLSGRDARNGEQFLARAQRIVGVEARIPRRPRGGDALL